MRLRIGAEVRRSRVDAGLSMRAVGEAAGADPSHLSPIERGQREASFATLAAVSDVLGLDLSVRLYPTTGPKIHDRVQAPIAEALLALAHRDRKRVVEVPVWRPVRGVMDLVLARPGNVVVAVEVQSELRRLEQQIRWSKEKAEALPSAATWSLLSQGRTDVQVSQLLVVRSTRASREIAREFATTLRTAFPASAAQAVRALRDPAAAWPGAAVTWAEVERGVGRILDRAPRGVPPGR